MLVEMPSFALAFGRLRQEDCKLEVGLDYAVRLCLDLPASPAASPPKKLWDREMAQRLGALAVVLVTLGLSLNT